MVVVTYRDTIASFPLAATIIFHLEGETASSLRFLLFAAIVAETGADQW